MLSVMLTQILKPWHKKGLSVFLNGPFKSLYKLEDGLMTLYTVSSFRVIDCQLV